MYVVSVSVLCVVVVALLRMSPCQLEVALFNGTITDVSQKLIK